jgi:thiamine biosynthesis lipoprotein ApbE
VSEQSRVQSPTRRELEATIRAVLPDDLSLHGPDTTQPPTVAAVGLGGVVTGYVWGRIRGRRIRKNKR